MTAPAVLPGPVIVDPATAALHRAVPFTRLADYGLDPADARELLARTASGEVWETVAAELGERQAGRSRRAERAGHAVTAGEAARYAAAAFIAAQLARNGDDDVKRAAYDRYAEALQRVCALSSPPIEPVDVPWRGSRLAAWLHRPEGQDLRGTVVLWGGMSGWGGAYLSVARAYARRGLACLLVEGPGQGLSRMRYGQYLDGDLVDGLRRFVDVLVDHPDLGGRVGLHGNSFGGLYAALLAAADDRVAACIVNGGPPRPVVPEFRSAREQILAAVGTTEATAAEDVLRRLAFDGTTAPVRCPLLVLHGDADPLVTRAEQEQFLVGADPDTSTLRSWPGGEHTLYGHAATRDALTADWMRDRLAS